MPEGSSREAPLECLFVQASALAKGRPEPRALSRKLGRRRWIEQRLRAPGSFLPQAGSLVCG